MHHPQRTDVQAKADLHHPAFVEPAFQGWVPSVLGQDAVSIRVVHVDDDLGKGRERVVGKAGHHLHRLQGTS